MVSIIKPHVKIIAAVVIFTLSSLFIGSIQAYAQDEPESYTNVKLWIYPEYDDPSLLVMLEGQIEGTEPPVEVKFLVPSTADMYSAGSMDAQGNYIGGPPNRRPSSEPGWDEISYQTTTDTFRVEYYDPIISDNPEKTISYMFRSLYPISDMEIIVQEPIGATDFTVSPEGERFVDGAGFTSYLYQYTSLDAATTIQFDITYTRTATEPSLSLSGETTASSPSSGENESPDYTLIVVILAVILVIIVAVLIWQRREAPVTRAERRRSARKSAKPIPQDSTPAPKFCSQCGNPVDKNDKFCTNCGTKIQ
jgi:hypothetical protein